MKKVWNGHDLIRLGYKPGPWFRDAIEAANLHKMDAWQLVKYLNHVAPPPPPDPIPLQDYGAAKFHMNIDLPENEEEHHNRVTVINNMVELMRTPTITTGAVMPDACPAGPAGTIPVGGVAVAKNAIHPGFHSADICCSVYATNFGDADPKAVLDAAHKLTHFGPGGRSRSSGWFKLLDDNKELVDRIEANYYTKDYIEKALMHIGTQGDGNHFLYVGMSDNTRDTWLVTHHGSRGFGAAVYKKGMHTAEKYRQELSPDTLKPNAWIPYDTVEGTLYWDALQIVREWTKLNHSVLHNKTLNAVKVAAKDVFWNEHNFVFKDGDLFYHAKGATPLDDRFVPDSSGGRRLIPLNMAEPILVVKGDTTKTNLGFAPHGAGRNTSRTYHKKKLESRGITTEQALKEETRGLDIRFFSGKPDVSELPSAYKNAAEVQRQIWKYDLGTVIDQIIPYGCIMAGEQEPFWKRKKKKK